MKKQAILTILSILFLLNHIGVDAQAFLLDKGQNSVGLGVGYSNKEYAFFLDICPLTQLDISVAATTNRLSNVGAEVLLLKQDKERRSNFGINIGLDLSGASSYFFGPSMYIMPPHDDHNRFFISSYFLFVKKTGSQSTSVNFIGLNYASTLNSKNFIIGIGYNNLLGNEDKSMLIYLAGQFLNNSNKWVNDTYIPAF